MHSDRKNSSWLSFQFIVMLLVALITLRLNLTHYGMHQFSLWILFASIWGFGAALDFGFGTSLVKYIAEYDKYEKENTNKLLSTSFFIFVVAGAILFFIGNAAAELFYFSNKNIIHLEEVLLFKKVFIVLGVGFIFQYMTIFYKSVLEGLNNFVITSKINLLNNFFVFLGVVIVSLLEKSILYLSLVYVISYLLTLIIYLFVFKSYYPQYIISIANFKLENIKRIFCFSLSVQFISIFSALIDPTIKYIIGSHYQINYVASYEIARRFAMAISGLFFTAFKIVLPKTSILKTKEDYRNFLLGEGIKYTRIGMTYSGIVFGVGTILIALIIKLWFHSDKSVIIFLLLALPESINNVGFTIYMFLIGIGKAHVVALIQFFNVIFISGTLIIGFELFNNIFGILGYFLTVLVVNIFMLLYSKKIVGFQITAFLQYIGIYKLILLLITLFSSTIVVYTNILSVYYTLGFLSILSLIIFKKEIKKYSTLFLNVIMGKNV